MKNEMSLQQCHDLNKKTYINSPYFSFDIKSNIKVGAPLVGTRLVHALSSFINMMLLAKLGRADVAAGTLIFSTQSTLTLIMWSFLYSLAVIVSRFHGAKDVRQVGLAVNAGILLAIFIAIPFSLLFWNADRFLLFFHQNVVFVEITKSYFHAFSFGVLPSLLLICFNEFVMGILRARLVIIWTLISSPLFVILGYALLFGKLGLPKLGVAGVAWAYSITYWLLFFIVLLYFIFTKFYRQYDLFKFKKESFLCIKKLIKLSIPIALQLGAVAFSYSYMTYMVGWLSESSLVAHQIATQYVNVAIMIPYGMAQSSAVLVSEAIGAKRLFVRQMSYSGVFMALALVALFSILYWIIPRILISGYLNLHDIKNYSSIFLAVILLLITGFIQLADTISIMFTGILRGFHDTKVPMVVAILCNWGFAIPIGYCLAFFYKFGVIGIYFGFLLASFFSVLLLINRFNKLCNPKQIYNSELNY
jgi:MATE family multidrug resistance protein